MRTLDRRDREPQQAPNVVVLCLDEHYPTTLARWLRSTGARVEIAESGRQASNCCTLARGSPTEYSWPGLSRLASLKRSHKLLRIVVIDRGDGDSRYVALAAGADAVVPAPLRRTVAMRAIGVAEASDRG